MLEPMRAFIPRRATRCARAIRGLTLLEMAMILAVVAVLGALAVPAMGARLDRQRAQAAAEKLAGDLVEARFEAAQRGQVLTVRPQPGAAWCWAVATTSACDCHLAQACAIRVVGSADHPGVRLVAGQPVDLQPGGSAWSGMASGAATAVFETRRGERLRVAVSALGRPRVCAESGTWPRIPPCGG
jgi:Tfp pilus assembly protein FimT